MQKSKMDQIRRSGNKEISSENSTENKRYNDRKEGRRIRIFQKQKKKKIEEKAWTRTVSVCF